MQKTKQNVLVNLSLLLISLVVILVFFEIILRLAEPSQTAVEKYSPTDDVRNYGNKFDTEYIENGEIYVINNDGLRADVNYTKIHSVPRIALLGDSVAFGVKVNYSQTFGAIIEKTYATPVQVINFGVSGYASAAEVETLKTKALQYHPDIVILNFVMNDIEPSSVMFSTTVETSCILPLLNMKVSCKVKDFIRNLRVVDFFYSKLKNTFYSTVDDYYTLAWSNDELYSNNIKEPLVEFKQICDANHIVCGVVIFPLLQFNSTSYKWSAQEQKLIAELDSLKLPYLSLLSTFQKHSAAELGGVSDDILHPNALGHEIAADSITKFIKQISR